MAWPYEEILEFLRENDCPIATPVGAQTVRDCQDISFHCRLFGGKPGGYACDLGLSANGPARLDQACELLVPYATGPNANIVELFWWNRRNGKYWFYDNGQEMTLAQAKASKYRTTNLADAHDDHIHVAVWPDREWRWEMPIDYDALAQAVVAKFNSVITVRKGTERFERGIQLLDEDVRAIKRDVAALKKAAGL